MIISNNLKSPEPQTFEGKFVRLLPFDCGRDSADLFQVSHDSEATRALWKYLPYGPFPDLEAFQNFGREWLSKPDMLSFTVRDPSGGQARGTLSLMSLRPGHGVAELGNIWYAPAVQGTKTNTEACYLLLRYCFEELHYRRMEWKCHSHNERSHRAALRLGFRYEGTFRQHMVVKGENRDTEWFSMLDHEWPGIKAAMEKWLYTDDSITLRELTNRL